MSLLAWATIPYTKKTGLTTKHLAGSNLVEYLYFYGQRWNYDVGYDSVQITWGFPFTEISVLRKLFPIQVEGIITMIVDYYEEKWSLLDSARLLEHTAYYRWIPYPKDYPCEFIIRELDHYLMVEAPGANMFFLIDKEKTEFRSAIIKDSVYQAIDQIS
jgi:hypothetical protein